MTTKKRFMQVALFAVLAIVVFSGSAMAFQFWLDEFDTSYPGFSSATAGSCAICHTSTTTYSFNPYGADLRDEQSRSNLSIADRLAAIENTNSDGDLGGFTNIVEINAGTQPGWTTTQPRLLLKASVPSIRLPRTPHRWPTPGTTRRSTRCHGNAQWQRLDRCRRRLAAYLQLVVITRPGAAGATLSDAGRSTDLRGRCGRRILAQLIVNDGTVDSDPATVMITAEIVVVNTPPVADAGPDQNLTLP